jgi:hypothetical protein
MTLGNFQVVWGREKAWEPILGHFQFNHILQIRDNDHMTHTMDLSLHIRGTLLLGTQPT